MSNALAKAMQGQKVGDSQTKGALSQAVDKLKNLQSRMAGAKDKAGAVGSALLHTAEMQSALFAGSFAEGYLGEDKMKLGPVDWRAGVGALGGAVGVYQVFTGSAAGAHVLAASNGLLGSAVASFGRRAGQLMKDKKDGKAPEAAPAPAMQPGTPNAGAEPRALPGGADLAGQVRDIFLTPESAADEHLADDESGGRRRSRAKPSRFIRVRAA